MSDTPDLWATDKVRLIQAASRWIDIARKERYGPDWTPSNADILKSCLLERLIAGKEPLPLPPPTAMSDPWYELIENGIAHFVPELFSAFSEHAGWPGNEHANFAIEGDGRWHVEGNLEPRGWLLTHPGAPGTWELRPLRDDEDHPKVGGSIATGTYEPILATWVLVRNA